MNNIDILKNLAASRSNNENLAAPRSNNENLAAPRSNRTNINISSNTNTIISSNINNNSNNNNNYYYGTIDSRLGSYIDFSRCKNKFEFYIDEKMYNEDLKLFQFDGVSYDFDRYTKDELIYMLNKASDSICVKESYIKPIFDYIKNFALHNINKAINMFIKVFHIYTSINKKKVYIDYLFKLKSDLENVDYFDDYGCTLRFNLLRFIDICIDIYKNDIYYNGMKNDIDYYYTYNEDGYLMLTKEFEDELNKGYWDYKYLPEIPTNTSVLDNVFKCIENVRTLYLDNSKLPNLSSIRKSFRCIPSVEIISMPSEINYVNLYIEFQKYEKQSDWENISFEYNSKDLILTNIPDKINDKYSKFINYTILHNGSPLCMEHRYSKYEYKPKPDVKLSRNNVLFHFYINERKSFIENFDISDGEKSFLLDHINYFDEHKIELIKYLSNMSDINVYEYYDIDENKTATLSDKFKNELNNHKWDFKLLPYIPFGVKCLKLDFSNLNVITLYLKYISLLNLGNIENIDINCNNMSYIQDVDLIKLYNANSKSHYHYSLYPIVFKQNKLTNIFRKCDYSDYKTSYESDFYTILDGRLYLSKNNCLNLYDSFNNKKLPNVYSDKVTSLSTFLSGTASYYYPCDTLDLSLWKLPKLNTLDNFLSFNKDIKKLILFDFNYLYKADIKLGLIGLDNLKESNIIDVDLDKFEKVNTRRVIEEVLHRNFKRDFIKYKDLKNKIVSMDNLDLIKQEKPSIIDTLLKYVSYDELYNDVNYYDLCYKIFYDGFEKIVKDKDYSKVTLVVQALKLPIEFDCNLCNCRELYNKFSEVYYNNSSRILGGYDFRKLCDIAYECSKESEFNPFIFSKIIDELISLKNFCDYMSNELEGRNIFD